MTNNKKFFPKLKKKIKNFLTDESWKITKKDALWLSVWAMIMSWVDYVSAAHSSSLYYIWHANWYTVWWHQSWYTVWWHQNWYRTTHSSSIVNWHSSGTPNAWHISWYPIAWHASWYPIAWHVNAASYWHSSHGSHGSHGSHWSY